MSPEKKAEQIVVKNVRVRYAKLIRPDRAFDESHPDLWSVNMYVNAEGRAQLIAAGATPKMDKDNAEYFISKRNVTNKEREAVKPPLLVDGKKQPFDQEVGNGSICNIALTPFPWEKGRAGSPGYKSGVLLYLKAVQVVEHVAMSNGVDAFDVVDEPTDNNNDGSDLPF